MEPSSCGRAAWTRRQWLSKAWAGSVAACTSLATSISPARELAARAPAILLAMEAPPHIAAVEQYLVSEKYDGERAWWSGSNLLHRSGAEIILPSVLRAQLPPHPLDGELWFGRGEFDALAALLRSAPDAADPRWLRVRYRVFEWPDAPGTFSQRVAALQHWVRGRPPGWIDVAPQDVLPDEPTLEHRLAEVVSGGGEGLMLHRADAPYVTGRRDVLLKLKPVQDLEAVVIGHRPGKGRLEGRTGALDARLEDGRLVRIGSGLDDATRAEPPPIGSRIVIRYRGLTVHGLPRFTSFWRRVP